MNKIESIFIKYTPLVLFLLILAIFINHLLRGLVVTPFIPLIVIAYINLINGGGVK